MIKIKRDSLQNLANNPAANHAINSLEENRQVIIGEVNTVKDRNGKAVIADTGRNHAVANRSQSTRRRWKYNSTHSNDRNLEISGKSGS